ncbi:MAG: fructose-bisphosphatase class II family protein [Candidatus Dormibacterales bacterium]
MEQETAGRLSLSGMRPGGALGLVRVTEQVALQAARLTGRGDQERAKAMAAAAMLQALMDLEFRARVVLSPFGEDVLSNGSEVGAGGGPEADLAVYPLEGASLVARGLPGAISMAVATSRGGFPAMPAVAYMDKIAVGALARGAIGLDDSVADNLRRVAFSRDCRVSDLTVAVLERPRHKELVDEVRASGARIMSLADGDIAGALLAGVEGTGVDAMMGVGGIQEAVMAAAALRCLGADIQCRLWPRNDEERILAGEEAARRYGPLDLCPAGVEVAITGVTGGALLAPVRYGGAWAETSSLVLSSLAGTIRRVHTRHRLPPDGEMRS